MAIVDPKNKTTGIHALGNAEAKVFKEFDLIPVDKEAGGLCREVKLVIERFTCRCPITGQPDHAKVVIRYEPQDFYLETKSLKLYIESFREVGIFHETLVSQILKDLSSSLLNPKRGLQVEARFDSRGGIAVEAFASDSDYFDADVSDPDLGTGESCGD